MEPKDFDERIKAGLEQGENQAHSHEIEQSRPYVWTAIQKRLEPAVIVMKWYSLAAAVILLLIGAGFLFSYLQNRHIQQLNLLSKQVQEMEQSYKEKQGIQAASKEREIKSLQANLKELQASIAAGEGQGQVQPEPIYVYRTDTIIIKEVEYVTEVLPAETAQPQEEQLEATAKKEELTEGMPEESNGAIFPSFNTSNSTKNKAGEGELRFKLSAFAN